MSPFACLRDNVTPPERTECLVSYDRDALYLAFRAFDRDPSAIRARLAEIAGRVAA